MADFFNAWFFCNWLRIYTIISCKIGKIRTIQRLVVIIFSRMILCGIYIVNRHIFRGNHRNLRVFLRLVSELQDLLWLISCIQNVFTASFRNMHLHHCTRHCRNRFTPLLVIIFLHFSRSISDMRIFFMLNFRIGACIIFETNCIKFSKKFEKLLFLWNNRICKKEIG